VIGITLWLGSPLGSRWEWLCGAAALNPLAEYGRAKHNPSTGSMLGASLRLGSRWKWVVRSSGVKPRAEYGRAQHNPDYRLRG